jgi:hypothetical protein
MNALRKIARQAKEEGTALLIAIFAVVLIGGLGAAMMLMSQTESAVAGSYRATAQSFYASYAGLEEGRGRLWPGHPNTITAMIGAPGAVLPVGQVRYILNPAAGEVVNPTNLVATNPYQDTQYQSEFGVPITSAAVQTTLSSSGALMVGIPGPMFKWVRITAKTERSANLDIDGNGILDNAIPIFYDGQGQNLTQTGRQVLRVTALSVMPNGARRILQYDLSKINFNLTFPAALTFDGTGSALFPANSNVYTVNGNDAASCGTPPMGPFPAIGTVSPGDDTAITASIPKNRWGKYTGSGPTPDVQDVSATLPPNLTTVAGLEGIVSQITANADNVTVGPTTSLPSYGSPTAPTIQVVQGDLSLSGNITGYGILLVTGSATFAGTVGWRGIVLVIGEGNMTVSGGGNNSFEGAVLLATTRDAVGNLLPTPGPTLLDWAGGGGSGVHYDSCEINNAQNNVVMRVLSFREVRE